MSGAHISKGEPFDSFPGRPDLQTALSSVVTIAPSIGAAPGQLWGFYEVPDQIRIWLQDQESAGYDHGLYALYSQLCQMADSAFGTVDFDRDTLNLAGFHGAADVFECVLILKRRGLLHWQEISGGHFWIILDGTGQPRAISDRQREQGLSFPYTRRQRRGISSKPCWQQYRESGGHCAMPLNHTVDHVAFSGTMTEPVDVWPTGRQSTLTGEQ
ncbi:hypothetical protein [Kutzneria buriramensis]|uniref:Uncharacterized protein n=1 Tax=Kutzneria buriramensis TaxID=1045776 RepID=A0A3E0HPG0_9PSEU|nr:hypothetical protein [Kutzneria buriramensis]REH48291.1 hypothetical protein BCF44_105149 [Kutzneria buriramensis]